MTTDANTETETVSDHRTDAPDATRETDPEEWGVTTDAHGFVFTSDWFTVHFDAGNEQPIPDPAGGRMPGFRLTNDGVPVAEIERAFIPDAAADELRDVLAD